jgi:hypothetical protein
MERKRAGEIDRFSLGSVATVSALIRSLVSAGRTSVSVADLYCYKQQRIKELGLGPDQVDDIIDQSIQSR